MLLASLRRGMVDPGRLCPQGSWKFLWVLPAAVAFGFLMGPIFLPLEKRRALRVADEILRAAR